MRTASFACAALAAACVGNGHGLDKDGRPLVPDAAASDAPTGDVMAADDAAPGSFAWIQTNVFDAICAVTCHVGAAAPKGLQLDAANAYALLVGVPSDEVPTLNRVSPGAPDDSYIIVKISATDTRRVGERMPRNGPPYLSDMQIQAIRDWIAAGAPGP